MKNLSIFNVHNIGLSASFIIGLILAANVCIPIQPVPFTLQTIVLMVAVLRDPKVAFHASLGYLTLGLMGFPIFPHVSSASELFASSNAGYVVGLVVATFVLTKLPKLHPYMKMVVGDLLVFSVGVIGLSRFLPLHQSFYYGFEVFIIPEIIKGIIAVKLNNFITAPRLHTQS